MGITKIPLVLMSGFYLDYKKRKTGFYRDYKNPGKWLWDSIWIPKKRTKKLFGGSVFFFRDSSGFYRILILILVISAALWGREVVNLRHI